jgi:hypothetical protein
MPDHTHQGGEKFELVFEAQASDVPPIARVKQLLKAALRSWRLRCTSARDVTNYPDGPPARPVDQDDATTAGESSRTD